MYICCLNCPLFCKVVGAKADRFEETKHLVTVPASKVIYRKSVQDILRMPVTDYWEDGHMLEALNTLSVISV